MPIVYLGLGSNLGDRQANIETALARLGEVPGISVQQVSDLRETTAVGGPPQGPYLNGVCRIACALTPHGLLSVLKTIEAEAGRDHGAPRNSPRPVDLDILLFGDRILADQDLTIPHPGLLLRDFMLVPLIEIAPYARHPGRGQPVRLLDGELRYRQIVERRQAPGPAPTAGKIPCTKRENSP